MRESIEVEKHNTIDEEGKGLRCMAQWSERSPCSSEVAGSILSENFLNVTRAQCSTHVKRFSQHSAESRHGFSPGTLVSKVDMGFLMT